MMLLSEVNKMDIELFATDIGKRTQTLAVVRENCA